MGFAVAGALGLSTRLTSRAGSRVHPSSSLLLLCLSTSSLLASASVPRPQSTLPERNIFPTCAVNNLTCPAPSGLRAFSSSSQAWSNSSQFSYHVAASYSAKRDKLDPERNLYTQNNFDSSSSGFTDVKQCVRQNDKRLRPRSGQDSFFHSQVGTSEASAFGVADGVGGWEESGVDPADFAHGLCEYMACAARMWPQGAKSNTLQPKYLLQTAFDEVTADNAILGGGSTACVAVAAPDGNVQVANLGDSGFMHLGLNAVRHFSHPQTHAFNTPFQLSKIPQRMLVQQAIFGASTLADYPKDANVTNHVVRHGDVLIFATDGVWDNLSPQDALGIVSRHMLELGAWVEKDDEVEVSEKFHTLAQSSREGKADANSLQAKLALAITKEAKQTGKDTRRDGPFAKEVQKHYPGENWHGGKPDDIATVVAVVVEK